MFEPDFTRPSCSSDAIKQEEEDYDEQEDDYDQPEDQEYAFEEFVMDNNNNTNHQSWDTSASARIYTKAELNPVLKDPCCEPNWVLANLWPVYVSNFRCAQPENRDNKIRLYFASKGLLLRWWFNQEDQYYFDTQIRAGLFDMLVYFVSEQDAELAISHCHRNEYNGYTLNVFPGREPSFFLKDCSIYYEDMKSGRVFSEQFFERRLARFGAVECVVKFDENTGAAEFQSPGDRANVSKRENLWKPLPVPHGLRKQRFLECDLMQSISLYLRSNPGAIQASDNHKYTKMLLSGTKPTLNMTRPYVVPIRRGPSKHFRMVQTQKKAKKHKKYIENCLARGEEPICGKKYKTKAGKKNFRKMVSEIKQQMFVGDCLPNNEF